MIIGSSMGAWIALNQFKYFKNQIVGMLGIGSAPEFLDRLMWNKFPKKIKNEIIKKGITTINHGDKKKYQYPISHQLIKDGRKNKVFQKKYLRKFRSQCFMEKKMKSFRFLFQEKCYQFLKKQIKNWL